MNTPDAFEVLAEVSDDWRTLDEYADDLPAATLADLVACGWVERRENGRVQIRRTSAGKHILLIGDDHE